MSAYYNEIDPFAAAWLRNLVAAGQIAPGRVDARSIVDVRAADLKGQDEAHFFAGIGVWSRALRYARWPIGRIPVWTGSAPCQPFSAAGRQRGSDDERHLWPVWSRLVDECRPPVIVGEQVASQPALGWFDALCADLEAAGYSVGAVDMCAAGLGAPHIRQRLWWVAVRRDFERLADPGHERRAECREARIHDHRTAGNDAARCGASCGMADTERVIYRRDGSRAGAQSSSSTESGAWQRQRGGADTECRGDAERLADRRNGATDGTGATHGAWRNADWIFCRDGKWRPVEPGTFPLADGAANRVGRLRAFGNAICLPVATWWVETVMDVLGLRGAL